MKAIKAVKPYIYPNQLNFKNKPFEAWKALGGGTVNGWYPRILHRLMFDYDMPTLWHGEARLCFVQPQTLYFDTGFPVLTHEIIPFVWDCWPIFFEKMAEWIERHNVNAAIFTCRETSQLMKERFPKLNVMHCPEGVVTGNYKEGKLLLDRQYDLLEFGRPLFKYVKIPHSKYDNICKQIEYIRTGALQNRLFDNELYEVMGNAKITICYPHYITEPEFCGGLETLTQRYWECMLSRNVIVGHCPQELIDLIGYNPVVEAEFNDGSLTETINDVLHNIEKYQTLVDKNRQVAMEMSDWKLRMKEVQTWLTSSGYKI